MQPKIEHLRIEEHEIPPSDRSVRRIWQQEPSASPRGKPQLDGKYRLDVRLDEEQSYSSRNGCEAELWASNEQG